MLRGFTFNFTPQPWTKQAACVGEDIDPYWWFPVGKPDHHIETKIAIQICRSCKVQFECLDYALANWPVEGIWGAMKQSQIEQLHKQRKGAKQDERNSDD